MKKYINYAFAFALSTVALTGCDDYLDTMPDNRATLDSEEKIGRMLVSAYPTHTYVTFCEISSDNVDHYGMDNPYTKRWLDEIYSYREETESDNESTERFWSDCYISIAACNESLKALDELGLTTATAAEMRGEALVARAYNHFMLASVFCDPYCQANLEKQGLPYMEGPETELLPKYERGKLGEFYEKIQKDLEEGLPIIGDAHLTIPRYHLNQQAAWAFATRFYLYTEQWEKAVEAAGRCLGEQPKTMLRNWAEVATMPSNQEAVTNEYISSSVNANLLILTAYSQLGTTFGAYFTNSRYSHGKYIATHEDMSATNIWGSNTMFRVTPKVYTGTNLDKTIFWKFPYKFEYTDLIAGVGYVHTVYPAFTTDECLLNRAEALIMLKRYDEAAADMTLWMQNITKSTKTLTPDNIVAFYKPKAYSYADEKDPLASTIKKTLNPLFAIDEPGSVQECMLQCVLGFLRIENMHNGLRWFDVRRFGIEYPRRMMNMAGVPEKQIDFLGKDDPRRTIQIPLKVRDAGLAPNPR